MVVDPLVEDGQESTSPYGYVFDNPIKNTDPDGRSPNGPGGDFVEGVKEGFVGYFTDIAHAVTNPVETIKNSFSAESLKTHVLDVATMGSYSFAKSAIKLANAAANGDFKTLGNAVGGKLAEGATMLATDGAVKGFNIVKGLVKDVRAVKFVSKYGHLKEPNKVGDGLKTTRAQRARILDANKAANGGVIKSDITGKTLDPPAPSRKGVKANMNQAEIDHYKPRSQGGSNSNSNLQVASKAENIQKSDKQ